MADGEVKRSPANRNRRQKQKTRNRLIVAALSVMGRKGIDAATINDITDAADVGFGSFYNHFTSKEDILSAASQMLFEDLGAKIDQAIAAIEDPCEAFGTAIRLFVNALIAEPEWAQFIIRTSAVPGYKHNSMYARVFRDIERIHSSGRLRIADSGIVTYAVGGAILFMVVALLDGDLPKDDAPARIAGMALRMLGLAEDELSRIVALPLPPPLKTDDFCKMAKAEGDERQD